MRACRAWKVVVLCCVGSLCLVHGVASASAHARYSFTGSFGEAGAGAGQLALSAGSGEKVANNPTLGSGVAASAETHDVYIADTGNHRTDEFDSEGKFIRAWGWGVANGAAELQTCTVICQQGLPGSAAGEFEEPMYVTVDNSPSGAGDVYIADTGDSIISKFDSSGNLIESWGVKGQFDGSSVPGGPFFEKSTGVGGIGGMAVDASGNLWVAVRGTVKTAGNHVYELAQNGKFILGWKPENSEHVGIEITGIAVDGFDNVYGRNISKEVSRYSSDGSPIGRSYHGEIIEGPMIKLGSDRVVSGVAADPVENSIYIGVGGVVERFASSCESTGSSVECVPLETFGAPESIGGAGLGVDPGSGVVYLLKPGSNQVVVFAPEVHRSPSVESESVSAVTADSATFSTVIDPNGSATSYRIEYGLSASYGEAIPVPDRLVGSGFETEEVSLHVQGLMAGETYHYRVVSYNEKGTTYGEDLTFVTQPAMAVFGLPDGREWELVTPAEKHGALFFGQNYGHLSLGIVSTPLVGKASINGNAMIDLASAPTETQPEGYSKEVSVLSTRGSDGWSSQTIAPTHKRATSAYLSEGGEYVFFSEDLSLGVVDPFGPFSALSPEASEATPYLRTDYVNGSVGEHCAAACYRPLVTATNTQSGVSFGGENEPNSFTGKIEPGTGCYPQICGPGFVAATPDGGHIVLRSFVQLTATPNEKPEHGPFYYEWGNGQLQPLYLLPESEGGGGVYAGELSSAKHQLSDAGSVFFVYKQHLYMHDVATSSSVRLDVAQGVVEPAAGGASFLYAASDGSRVLFSDSQQLTSTGSGGVYECRIVETTGAPACELALTGVSAAGTFIGGGSDASYLYFEDASGHLVVDHYSNGEWTATSGPYVGAWARSNTSVVGFPLEVPVSRISPNGRWLTFMSEEELTGYDNHDAISGRADVEVYLYDAAVNKLVCASCNPTHGRPVGAETGFRSEGLVEGSLDEHVWVAANLPPWVKGGYNGKAVPDLYQPRFLSNSGRLFFDSHDALVPQDVNGSQDAYEWEPAGVGDCTTSAAGFSEQSGGCVGLLSAGSSPEESAFMDASETGGDAFFITLSKLTAQDFDAALDVYDAHECSVQAPCALATSATPPPCSTGDACKAAPTPQPSIFGAPASATFTGAGNVAPSEPAGVKTSKRKLSRAQMLARALKACAKKPRARRAACERVARKRFGRAANHGKRG